jgi:hypothetical protein
MELSITGKKVGEYNRVCPPATKRYLDSDPEEGAWHTEGHGILFTPVAFTCFRGDIALPFFGILQSRSTAMPQLLLQIHSPRYMILFFQALNFCSSEP